VLYTLVVVYHRGFGSSFFDVKNVNPSLYYHQCMVAELVF